MGARKISLVVGTRPNFVKAAPLLSALRSDGGFEVRLIHTGQHFDAAMSQVFFKQLQMDEPDAYLGIKAESSTTLIAKTMMALEDEFRLNPPELVVVFGDVNSTLAGALVANKMNLPLAHVEAGLRSFDREMPEEHNRILTDAISNMLFTPSEDANQNLRREGVPSERIFFVGNIMVDSLLRFAKAEELKSWESLGLEKGKYALLTLHRPANVDTPEKLEEILLAIRDISQEVPVVFPVHPRTMAELQTAGISSTTTGKGIQLVEPMGYLEFISMLSGAKVVLTDSGGIQEETTILGVPCLTIRENTERPITISKGTNRLVGVNREGILRGFQAAISEKVAASEKPELWDGKTSVRIAQVLKSIEFRRL